MAVLMGTGPTRQFSFIACVSGVTPTQSRTHYPAAVFELKIDLLRYGLFSMLCMRLLFPSLSNCVCLSEETR